MSYANQVVWEQGKNGSFWLIDISKRLNNNKINNNVIIH